VASCAIHFASTACPVAAWTMACATSWTNAPSFASCGSAGDAGGGADEAAVIADGIALVVADAWEAADADPDDAVVDVDADG
jgi:hypothetical protein